MKTTSLHPTLMVLLALGTLSVATQSANAAMTSSSASSSTTTSTTLTADQAADLRLALDKVNVYNETGRTEEATQLLNQLKQRYPNNPDVLAAQADIATSTEENPGSILDLCAAKNLDPAMVDIMQREPNTPLPSRGTFACAGYNRRITTEALEQIANLDGQTILDKGTSFAFDLQNDHMNTQEPFTRVNRQITSFYGDRQQGTFTFDKMFDMSNEGGASLYANNTNIGGGLQYRLWDSSGSTSIKGNVNKPVWDYVEQVVEYGTESDITVERQQIITRDFHATLDIDMKQYSLDGDGNAADAPGGDLSLDYEHSFNFMEDAYHNPDGDVTLGGHYNMDAEYFTHVGRSIDAENNKFNPLPAHTFEDHSFTISADKTFLDQFKAELVTGIGVNRISGSHGPIYAGSLTYNPYSNLGIDIHASRNELGGQNESEKEDILGASLKLMW